MKKLIALLLAFLLCLSLGACGKPEPGIFRSLETIGVKHYSVICRGGDKLATVIDAAMESLAGNGSLSAISVRWLGSDRTCLKGDPGAVAALGELPEPRLLTIGVESEFYPIAYLEGEEHRGLCVDIAYAIGELLGWDVQILSISPNEVSTQLSSGNIDCAVGFDSGLVKATEYSAGECFLESNILLAVRSDSEVKHVKDLAGSRVGTISDPSVLKALRSDEKLTKYASGATEYLSLARCIEALDKGWCSAVVLDALMLSYYQMQQ